jgi:arylformamidase
MNWIRLSHILSLDTPAYGGGEGLSLEKVRDMEKGDSCNASHLSFSNHLGTHVDAPCHFIADGKSIDKYDPQDWVFQNPVLLDVPVTAGEILGIGHFESILPQGVDSDILLIRTGFEDFRGQKSYWELSPAFAPELANYFRKRLPSLVAIGLDTISISSLLHRDMGREAHRIFLGQGLRIFEDMSFKAIQQNTKLTTVIAAPLLIDNIEGSPCTVFGSVNG